MNPMKLIPLKKTDMEKTSHGFQTDGHRICDYFCSRDSR